MICSTEEESLYIATMFQLWNLTAFSCSSYPRFKKYYSIFSLLFRFFLSPFLLFDSLAFEIPRVFGNITILISNLLCGGKKQFVKVSKFRRL